MGQKLERSHIRFRGKWLGTVEFEAPRFSEKALGMIQSPEFQKLSIYDKHDRIARTLLREIQKAPKQAFLLPHVLDFLVKVRETYPSYNLASFEFFLNYFTEISDEEKFQVRAKIVGRHVPRREYQKFFPIGGGAFLPGAHFVVAHFSPDLDTTVASFIGFLDAFAAKVSHGRHYWVVPGGPPKGSVEIDILFKQALGEQCFSILSQQRKRLTLSSMDLLTQHNLVKKHPEDLSYGLQHSRDRDAIIVVDHEGHYVADWRIVDYDIIRAMIGRFVGMIREHLNHFHNNLVGEFAKAKLKKKELESFLKEIMDRKLSDCNVGKELTDKHRVELDQFLKKILGVDQGIVVSYRELLQSQKDTHEFASLLQIIDELTSSNIFGSNGHLTDDRTAVFTALENLVNQQSKTYERFFRYLDTLEVALQIKKEVLGHEANYLSHMDNYEDIKEGMGSYANLTVIYDENGKRYPLGTIQSLSLKKWPLATMSMRDFSNFLETDKPDYIDVASVIDHHKSDLQTNKPFINLSGDCQSSNTLVAKYSMEINDCYSIGGMTLEEVEAQLADLAADLETPSNFRIFQRLLKRKAVWQGKKAPYYISFEREFIEYYQCLHAILDDTDLLTKVTEIDVEVVADLINRLKSLMLGKEVEIVHFDDLARSEDGFAKRAAQKLLQCQDLYSVYSYTYRTKEQTIDELIKATAKGGDTHFFQDTKILNKYAVIGQFKYFVQNIAVLHKKVHDLRKIWVKRSSQAFNSNSELTVHIFMLSSVFSAEELFSGMPDKLRYKDEVWLWVPPKDKRALHQLQAFLSDFRNISVLKNESLEVEIYSSDPAYEKALEEGLHKAFKKKLHKSDLNLAILKVPPRTIVSRKSQVVTCL